MNSRFPQFGFNDVGQLEPVHGVFHYVSAGAMVTLPLRNRNQGEVAAARAEHTGAQARLEATQLAARADLAAAEAQDSVGRRALAMTESIVGLAAKSLDVVRQAPQLGRDRRRSSPRSNVGMWTSSANTETMKARMTRMWR
jgi:outer membrane protein TolC